MASKLSALPPSATAGLRLAVAARATYNRARRIDLERGAGAVEDKLGG